MKVLLCDDEAPARALIREYLADYPQLELVAEAANGIEAVRLIGRHDPDLVFLDVEMPGLTGFEVLQSLPELPKVIFATAFDRYAIRAFDLCAVDYLLKPFTRERFARSVERVLNVPVANLNGVQALAERLLATEYPARYPPKLLVSVGSRIVAVGPETVLRIEADGDYAQLVTDDGTFLTGTSLGSLQEKLDPAKFFRVHRSAIVNIARLREVRREGSTFYAVLDDGHAVRVSRANNDLVKSWIV